MDQSQMLSILGGLYDKLVTDVAAKVTAQLSAAGAAQITMDSEVFKDAVRGMLDSDPSARDTIRDLITDHMGSYDITDNREFSSLASKVDDLEAKVDDLDADNDTFADAVCQVIRSRI